MNTSQWNHYQSLLLGVAVGDALGVPVEFESRARRRIDPVVTMRGYGTHNQPSGTWSDDSSLTFCLAESISQAGADAIDLQELSRRFINWLDSGYWTPHGQVFDVGVATRTAIGQLRAGVEPEQAGGKREYDNGNGALMRILPLIFHPLWQTASPADRQQLTHRVCSLTHGHVRSTLACYFYLEIAWGLLQGLNPDQAHERLYREIPAALIPTLAKEIEHFAKVLDEHLALIPQQDMQSTGYVVHTLEAALWCLLRGEWYADTVLTAVNLGDDSDTTGAVTGGLAGLYYGVENIPTDWLNTLVRRADIEALAEQLANSCTPTQ
ncbi:ADP-ribosylation/Crystallin J1 [Hymenobacter roseosalivarius DSM 11622]|uniref:ADP-ribosylation/Crystallin J1 n=1 Tax=Hymenobacter roseosalivarius DSM 11622 TaxID=645990 RepID=A0A1W1VZ93_9BACT|nr:ADP-ribosylglycohydrolase family protein [Hymenobacter roseosalivarius]SMB98668.1 ADP-ribosylation/Crystallin J1 [Hymenobacter roseosalivarius DSM 11622]